MNWSSQSQVIIQGIADRQAVNCAVQMKAYGTKVVAGINPGKGGEKLEDIPLFDLVEEAIAEFAEVDTSLIFVPAYDVLDAGREAIAAGIKKIIIFTAGVPCLDTIELLKYAEIHHATVLGPGSEGVIIPEQLWLGKLQPQVYRSGKVGLISSSEYYSYEVAWELNQAEIGQSIAIVLGNERIIGSNLADWLAILNCDVQTEVIVAVGQNTNDIEEITACCRKDAYAKPIIIYIVGLHVPQEKVFRDATTIITNHLSASIPAVNRDRDKLEELRKAGIIVAKSLDAIPDLVQDALVASKSC